MALRTSDFDRLYRQAQRRERSRRFLVLASRSPEASGRETRWGLSVKARLGGAVVRNRIKRRLREMLRGAGLPPGWDIVVQPLTAEVARAEFGELRDELRRLLERALRSKKDS